MATTTKPPRQGVQINLVGEIWQNPNNITPGSTTPASVALGNHDESAFLVGKDYDFSGLSGTISGIKVTLDCAASTANVVNSYLALTKDGVNAATASVADSEFVAGTPLEYGGSSDLWGISWSLSDIKNNASFGVIVRLENYDSNQNRTGKCTTITVEVTTS